MSASVVLVAGLAKAYDTMAFLRALGTWTLIPEQARLPLALTIPSIEIGVASMVAFGVFRKIAMIVLMILLCMFTGVYLLELATGKPPDCGCFGMMKAFASEQAMVRLVLARNCVLILVLFASWWNLFSWRVT
jgi:uncharacterized membrane protein YphA (DoxX/SURF4 family)